MTDHSELIARLEQLQFSYRLNNEVSTNCRQAAAALREQAGEIERLNKWADGFSDAQLKERQTAEAYQRELRAERDTLARENAGLRKDAERYRWLRVGVNFTIAPPQFQVIEWQDDICGNIWGDQLDAAIDAAKETQNGSRGLPT